MKRSEIYKRLEGRVDDLQKQLKNSARDQLVVAQSLENHQGRLKSLMQMMILEGDRDLTEEELVVMGLQ